MLNHDKKIELIKLNKANPAIEFRLNAEDSYMLIKSVSVTSKTNNEHRWANFITKFKLAAEFKYIVVVDAESRFIDERKSFQIQFPPNINQVQPIFRLNLLIKNETFTIGSNPEKKWYQSLNLELKDIENFDDEYTFDFVIEKFKM